MNIKEFTSILEKIHLKQDKLDWKISSLNNAAYDFIIAMGSYSVNLWAQPNGLVGMILFSNDGEVIDAFHNLGRVYGEIDVISLLEARERIINGVDVAHDSVNAFLDDL